MFEQILRYVYLITSYIIGIYGLYMLFISFFSIKKPSKKYTIVEDKQKFCVFIPCHNEEDVIGATIKNMGEIKYNAQLVDFYVIADNCKDATAQRAREKIQELKLSNFTVFERNVDDKRKRGKPHALRWGIEKLEKQNKFYSYYDMFMIFDSDNFADSNILQEINSQFKCSKPNKKPCMIQCYLDSKNANSIIAKGYNYAYRIFSNRTPQLGRSRLGINGIIGGTGFAITIKFLKEIGGYNASSLTEDLEIQTVANVKNEYILFNPFTRIYDEKPTGFKQSLVQKFRWSQGHWFVCFKYIALCFLNLFKNKSISNFISKIDHIIYLLTQLVFVCIFVNFIVGVLGLCLGANMKFTLFNMSSTLYIILSVASSVYLFILYPLIIIKQDGTKKEKHLTLLKIPNIYVSILIASIIYIFAACRGMFTWPAQTKWVKTKHVQTTNDNAQIVVNEEIVEEIEEIA